MNNGLSATRPAIILLVEDNENDVELMRLSFKKSRLTIDLRRARDGEECMAYLRKGEGFADVPTPDLILLDLNMPRKDGREVMAEMAADDKLCHLPVVILTTSADEEEVLSLYRLRCSSYIVKPIDFGQFSRVIQTITDYWFTIVVLPVGHPSSPLV